MATHSSILAWEIPWAEEPGYSPWVAKELDTTKQLKQQQIYFLFFIIYLLFTVCFLHQTIGSIKTEAINKFAMLGIVLGL